MFLLPWELPLAPCVSLLWPTGHPFLRGYGNPLPDLPLPLAFLFLTMLYSCIPTQCDMSDGGRNCSGLWNASMGIFFLVRVVKTSCLGEGREKERFEVNSKFQIWSGVRTHDTFTSFVFCPPLPTGCLSLPAIPCYTSIREAAVTGCPASKDLHGSKPELHE